MESSALKLIVGFALTLTALVACGGAPAQTKMPEGRITLQVAPPQISLVPAGSVIAVVQAVVPTGDIIDDVMLSVPDIDGIHVRIEQRDAKGPGDLLWDLHVSGDFGTPADVQVPVIVSWRAGTDGVRRAAVTSFHVVIQPPISASITLRLQTEFAVLTEVGNHRMTLFVENRSGLPLWLSSVKKLSGPKFIAVDFPLVGNLVVQPGDVLAVNGEASLIGDYTPQSQQVELRVSFASADGHLRFEKTIASPILVAIPGLGDAMKAVEAPSLILLPGLITLVAAAALRARLFRWRTPDAVEKDIEWKTPGFWIVAITLSGVISWGAYRFAGIDLSDSYRFEHVIALWALSLSIFPICYLLWSWSLGVPLGWAARLMKFLLQDRFTVTERDSALTVLEKLHLNRSGFYLRSVRRELYGTTEELFVLSEISAAEGKAWVVPGLVVTGTRYPHREAATLDRLLNDPTKAHELLNTLVWDCGRPLSPLGAVWARLAAPPPQRLMVSFEPGSLGQPVQLGKDDLLTAGTSRSAPHSILRRGRTW